ncbi:hypothetical protein OUZ56_017605 [Daphnia magna]|uniref:Uncharacterized protein n=1 Tax=Daphnia magna TaxID=35525 RepID=A0ABR0AT78_9CRUS|nr:hypothetical protein OUZ56_017605 [Daphnia magna]
MELESVKTAFSISNNGNNMTRRFCNTTQPFCNLVYAVTMGSIRADLTNPMRDQNSDFVEICSKHAARTETMKKKYVLNLNYPNPRVANSGQYTAADDFVYNINISLKSVFEIHGANLPHYHCQLTPLVGHSNPRTFRENTNKESSFWVSPEGQKFTLTWTADDAGFQPKGDHFPVAPVHEYELPVAPVHEYELPVAPVHFPFNGKGYKIY